MTDDREVFCANCKDWQPFRSTVLGMHRCPKCWLVIRPCLGIDMRRVEKTTHEPRD